MAIKIQIPTALRGFTDRKGEISLEGDTVGAALAALTQAYPDIKPHLYHDDGELRSFINVYVGEANIKKLDGLATKVPEGGVIMLVPAIAGGSSH
ncbi:MAG: MoaD/ThiS family protein [Zoogloeaceae bacterium]|jgi:adenylyltransferase/sulfurtransferase|nr:MoaD/ThiS family protein [Zoogloeaceae bacterium]